MRRAEALKGLSREHHEALVLARHASAAATDPQGVAAKTLRSHLLERWAQQFEPHFALEEQTLFPALARAGHHAPVAIALAEHVALRALVERLRQGDAAALPLWGDAMASHVRFEERSLFPLAQTVFEPPELTDVMKPSAPSPTSST
jgi:hemerythrin-like domain-containing protein